MSTSRLLKGRCSSYDCLRADPIGSKNQRWQCVSSDSSRPEQDRHGVGVPEATFRGARRLNGQRLQRRHLLALLLGLAAVGILVLVVWGDAAPAEATDEPARPAR